MFLKFHTKPVRSGWFCLMPFCPIFLIVALMLTAKGRQRPFR